MQKDLIKQWAQLSKKANDSLKKINTLNTKSIKQLTKLQMDMVSSCLEGSMKKAETVTKATTMAELMNLQSSLYKELSEKVLESAQNSVKIAMETKQAMAALIKEGLTEAPSMVVKASLKKAAPKPVAKKAAPKPVAKKAAPKPAAKKTAPKPAAKKTAPKPAAKKTAPKPVAKKTAPKPVAKKAAPKQAAKKTAPEPVVKKAAPKPVAKLQMPKPSGRPMTEGDAKK
ncbi:MAG TPA: phasin family protein [Cycloclasticus sp.]|nr:phasin family protein [Cycloclasticus sp.]